MAGAWHVEPALDRISCDGESRTLRPQVMELLVYLAARQNEAVSTEQLLGELWDGRVVTEGSVYNCVHELRSALTVTGDDSPSVETIPKKGYRLLLPVADVLSNELNIVRRARTLWVAAAAIAGLAVLAYGLFYPAPESGEIESLVILPLENLSADPAVDEYLAAGLTELLIARLSQLDNLRVISRTSSMQLGNSGMSVPEIARTLDVDGVVEGSLLKAADEIRLTLQLIDGRSDTHLWANVYTRRIEDVIGLQEEIANEIAAELNTLVGNGREVESFRPPTKSPDAYRAYLHGRFYFNSHDLESFKQAIALYDEAIRLDPDFALALAARSEVCNQPVTVLSGLMTIGDCVRDAQRAVQLDPGLAEAQAALGYILLIEGQAKGGRLHLEKAIALNPNSVMARQWYTLALLWASRPEEALEQIRLAEELDPLNLFVRSMVGWPLQALSRYEEAIAQWDNVLDLDPNFMLAHYNRGMAYLDLGEIDEVFAAADAIASINGEEAFEAKALRASGLAMRGRHAEARELLSTIEAESGEYMAAWIASIHLLLGDEDTALTWLERGAAIGSPDMGTIGEKRFDVVREHPRFRALRTASRRGN